MIPCDTANPLNSFLNSGLTLKFSVLFSMSAVPSSWLLANRPPSKRDRPGHVTEPKDYCFPTVWQDRNPEIAKYVKPEIMKSGHLV